MTNRLRRLLPLAAPLAGSVFILLAAPAQYLGRQQDDILYVLASISLAHGRYHLPISPAYIPLTMVNPGLPAALLPVAWIFGDRLGAFQAVSAAMAAALPWAYWGWLSGREEEPGRSLLVLLFSASPFVLSQSGCVMSEIPFLLLLFPFLRYLERGAAARPAASGAWLLALCELRLAALSLVPAAFFETVRSRRWKQAAVVAAFVAGGLAPWFAWSRAHGGVQKLSEWSQLDGGIVRALATAGANSLYYARAWGRTYLPEALAWLAAALGALLAALALRGAVRLWRDGAHERPALWALAGGIALYLVWPWHYDRYLLTLLPWMLWTMARGTGRWKAGALALLLAGQFYWGSRPWISGDSPYAAPGLQETYSWIRAHTKPWEALASPLYARDGFYAQRPCLPIPDAGSASAFSRLLKQYKARIVLREDRADLGFSTPRFSPIMRELARDDAWLDDPSLFRLLYRNPDEGTAVYAPR